MSMTSSANMNEDGVTGMVRGSGIFRRDEHGEIGLSVVENEHPEIRGEKGVQIRQVQRAGESVGIDQPQQLAAIIDDVRMQLPVQGEILQGGMGINVELAQPVHEFEQRILDEFLQVEIGGTRIATVGADPK